MSEDPIEKALGIRPIQEALRDEGIEITDDNQEINLPEVVEEKETLPTSELVDPDADETVRDIELARTNIQNIIKQGDLSLKDMLALANQSESPRAYEVAATLMKTLLEANKDFVEMSTKKKYAKEEILRPKEDAHTTNVTNNNLILSTTDILRMIKGEKE